MPEVAAVWQDFEPVDRGARTADPDTPSEEPVTPMPTAGTPLSRAQTPPAGSIVEIAAGKQPFHGDTARVHR